MATNSLAASTSNKYQLAKADRKNLLAGIPPKIQYSNGIVSFSALEHAI